MEGQVVKARAVRLRSKICRRLLVLWRRGGKRRSSRVKLPLLNRKCGLANTTVLSIGVSRKIEVLQNMREQL